MPQAKLYQHLSKADQEKVAILLREITVIKGLKADAKGIVKQELHIEIQELVAKVNGIIGMPKQSVYEVINKN